MAGKISVWLKEFCRDERGATAIEYGLILATISIVVATATATIGTRLTDTFTQVGTYLK
jgi:pilus assembly protein Flp/PilA